MAACGVNGGANGSVRVRLLFDYPPPAVADSRRCWLLVDLSACRVVADLESVIKERFEFSRGSVLSLFIEDCYLPHTESVHVVRDNDSVRVKVHCLAQANGLESCPGTSRKSCRKRRRPTEDAEPRDEAAGVEWKKKKRKKKSEALQDGAKEASNNERTSWGNHTQEESKRKKRKKSKKAEGISGKPKAAASSKKIQTVQHPVKGAVKPSAAAAATIQHASSSDSSIPSKSPPANQPVTSPSPKGRTKDASEHRDASPTVRSTTHLLNQAARKVVPVHNEAREPGTSDSEEDGGLVNQPPTEKLVSGVATRWSGRDLCNGKARYGGREEKGRGRGDGGSFAFSHNGAKDPSYQTASLTSTSVVLQNRVETAPKKDYSSMPLLAAPPQVGQKIAFKLLELTENYTPEVSEYKEGKILSFDPTTKQVELELLQASQVPAEPGKFDLVYQNLDGTERVEYAVPRGPWVTERWDCLLEPKLII